ncbi:MAG: hypothetical protein ACR2P4_02635 [Gammaproteobacteria bacterium]
MTETNPKLRNISLKHAAKVAEIAEALLFVAKRYKRELSVDAAYKSAAIIHRTINHPPK